MMALTRSFEGTARDMRYADDGIEIAACALVSCGAAGAPSTWNGIESLWTCREIPLRLMLP